MLSGGQPVWSAAQLRLGSPVCAGSWWCAVSRLSAWTERLRSQSQGPHIPRPDGADSIIRRRPGPVIQAFPVYLWMIRRHAPGLPATRPCATNPWILCLCQGLPWPLQVESLGDNPVHPWTCWPASGSGPSVSITGLTRGWRTPVTLAPDLSARRGCRAETWTRAGRAGTPATMRGTAAQPPQPSQRPTPGASGDCGVIMTRPASISPRQLGSHASRGLALHITASNTWGP